MIFSKLPTAVVGHEIFFLFCIKYINILLAFQQWVEAYHAFEEASGLAGTGNTKSMWGQFWGSHQRFFKYLCIASKVKHAVKAAQDAIADGKCVVIGLQSTGEARTLEEVDNHGSKLNDFVSTAK